MEPTCVIFVRHLRLHWIWYSFFYTIWSFAFDGSCSKMTYNRNNTRKVHINMARRARALLFPVPRVNTHVDMDPEDLIPFITWFFLKIWNIQGRHYRAISKVILTGWYCPVYCVNHVIKWRKRHYHGCGLLTFYLYFVCYIYNYFKPILCKMWKCRIGPFHLSVPSMPTIRLEMLPNMFVFFCNEYIIVSWNTMKLSLVENAILEPFISMT